MKLNFEEFYQDYLNQLAAYNLALSTMYVDQATIAPKDGLPYSNEAMSILSGMAFELENNPEMIEKMEDYLKRLPEDSMEAKEIRERLKEINKTRNVPAKEFRDYIKSRADSEMIWHEAKEKADYELFKPYLKDLMDRSIALVKYDPAYKDGDVYNVKLDEFEEGMNEEKYDQFFETIKRELVPFIAKINEAEVPVDETLLHTVFDVNKQAAFSQHVLDYLNRDKRKVYITTTEHPFTDFLSLNDMRITTHYYPDQFLAAVLSTVHEYGHALFGMQLNPALEKTALQSSIGSAAHESQSRLLENHIGRSLVFWQANYDALCETFPEFKAVTPEDIYKMVNISHNTLIRTEASELTYPLHILIRYEIEKMIARGELDYDKLPEIWADKYEKYLGIRPANDREGVLQDMHWSAGDFGYFPTYALGTAYAAQIYEAMAKEIDVDKALAENNFNLIQDWLKENVHQYGGLMPMDKIVEQVSGKPFDPMIYINYLKDKYSKIYNL